MAKQKLYWRVHTPNLLTEVLNNPGTSILAKPINIFGKILEEVAERASELNDPELNRLMIQLTCCSVADPHSPDHNPEVVREYLDDGALWAAG